MGQRRVDGVVDREIVVVRDAREPSSLVPVEHSKKVVGQINQLMSDPIPVLTKSGQPLAADIGEAICQGFRLHRWNCDATTTNFRGTVKDEIPFIVEGPPVDRILYVYISKYHATVSSDTLLAYDFDVTIWNHVGVFLSSTGEHGTRELETSTFLNPAENASQMAPEELQDILSGVLNAKPVHQALRF